CWHFVIDARRRRSHWMGISIAITTTDCCTCLFVLCIGTQHVGPAQYRHALDERRAITDAKVRSGRFIFYRCSCCFGRQSLYSTFYGRGARIRINSVSTCMSGHFCRSGPGNGFAPASIMLSTRACPTPAPARSVDGKPERNSRFPALSQRNLVVVGTWAANRNRRQHGCGLRRTGYRLWVLADQP